MSRNFEHIHDIKYLLELNNVDPAVIKRACAINNATEAELRDTQEKQWKVAGWILVCGILMTQNPYWQLCVPLFILAYYAAPSYKI
jgi:hypothetical protein